MTTKFVGYEKVQMTRQEVNDDDLYIYDLRMDHVRERIPSSHGYREYPIPVGYALLKGFELKDYIK